MKQMSNVLVSFFANHYIFCSPNVLLVFSGNEDFYANAHLTGHIPKKWTSMLPLLKQVMPRYFVYLQVSRNHVSPTFRLLYTCKLAGTHDSPLYKHYFALFYFRQYAYTLVYSLT
ncbi:proline iminopeptidase [Iris pallida]|nr:proline iminopeptidase [Iris pallida]